jgi:hypothetical protein
MKNDLIVLGITLNYSDTPIWRAICVDPDISLYDLHRIIKIAFEDTEKQPYRFIIGETNQNEIKVGKDKITLLRNILLNRRKEKIIYKYDCANSIEYSIKHVAVTENTDNVKYPVCIGAEGLYSRDINQIQKGEIDENPINEKLSKLKLSKDLFEKRMEVDRKKIKIMGVKVPNMIILDSIITILRANLIKHRKTTPQLIQLIADRMSDKIDDKEFLERIKYI